MCTVYFYSGKLHISSQSVLKMISALRPTFYGLPKLYKEGYPCRSILASHDSEDILIFLVCSEAFHQSLCSKYLTLHVSEKDISKICITIHVVYKNYFFAKDETKAASWLG